MGVARKQGDVPRGHESWRRELVEAKKDMGLEGLGESLLGTVPGLKKYPNKLARRREGASLSFADLTRPPEDV